MKATHLYRRGVKLAKLYQETHSQTLRLEINDIIEKLRDLGAKRFVSILTQIT